MDHVVPVQEVSIHVVGDAFVDLFCFLESDLPESGGDSLLEQPVKTMAGGSAVNTTTHLSSLLVGQSTTSNVSLRLQTAVNPNDEYGKLLLNHASNSGFELENCLPEGSSFSTGHCVVIISNGERSFMTHRGCIEEFSAEHIKVQDLISPSLQTAAPASIDLVHHAHIHIAGYYNMENFWDGRLKHQLQLVREERKRLDCKTTTTISLVPQHDATGKWNGQILDLLPLLDFLIVNELEANSIMQSNRSQISTRDDGENEEQALSDSTNGWASFFGSVSPETCIIVTRGSRGAVALRGGNVVATQVAPHLTHDNLVDPTGAGDAFAAGFLHGIWKWKLQQGVLQSCLGWPSEAIREGLVWGCAVGTSCVMVRGASVPAPMEEIVKFVNQAKGPE